MSYVWLLIQIVCDYFCRGKCL